MVNIVISNGGKGPGSVVSVVPPADAEGCGEEEGEEEAAAEEDGDGDGVDESAHPAAKLTSNMTASRIVASFFIIYLLKFHIITTNNHLYNENDLS